jgi:hypothetical protein
MESPLSFDSTENFRKKLLLKNLKPYRVDGYYSSPSKVEQKDLVLIDYSVIDTTPLDVTSKLIEPTLIGLNKYTPGQDGFGNIVNINVNQNTQTNQGFYEYSKSIFSTLENIGKNKKTDLLVQNQYGPETGQSKFIVNPNINFQVKANEGNYGTTDSVGSDLELKGNEQEKVLRVLNKFGPQKQAGQYGQTVLFDVFTLGANAGEYLDQTDADGSLLETIGQAEEIKEYTRNKYAPRSRGRSYGSTVNINKYLSIGSNFGEYLPTESSGNDSLLEVIGEQNLVILLNNQYQPNVTTLATPNNKVEQKPSKGEYDYETSLPSKTTQESKSFFYTKNKYNNGEGSFSELTIEDFINQSINKPYLNSDSTFAFIPSEYLPISILSTDNVENINGSDGSLSQDSALAQIGAKQLQKEFKTRVAFELLQQTLGSSTLTNSTINPDSGGISVQPKLNPFDALGALSNNLPIIQRDFKITQSPNIVARAIDFTNRLSGLYSPYSLIPGSYFDYPNKNFLNQSITEPVGATIAQVGNLLNKITTPFINSASELFLANTSPAVRNILFDQLFFNNYRPNYLLSSIQSPNLTAPKGNFYVGTSNNYLKDLVSPKIDQPAGKFGNANNGPVYSYSEVSKEYEGQKVNDILFGVFSKPYYDSVGIQGGLTWIANGNIYSPGKFVGPGNKQINSAGTDTVFEQASFGPEYNKSKSTEYSFKDGSLLDITQKLVDAANNSPRKTEHVGNAINQVSKVFKDGLVEMTKGSRVIRYTTPTSINKTPAVKGYEYCRLFTKDRPYFTFNELQKTGKNIRNFDNSVLSNTYNLNIAPMSSSNNLASTNIVDGKVKKYMFSIENLAWRTSNRPGYTVDSLPDCEKGPNGGRIMWFPPYDLTYNDTSSAQWDEAKLIGRPEPIYFYKSTTRTGSISFKIVVDHPSILNVLVQKELEKESASEATKIIDSFFAGCLKYDPIDLLKKYRQFSLDDIFEATEALTTRRDIQKVVNELPKENIQKEVEVSNNEDITNNNNQTSETQQLVDELNDESKQGGKFEEIILFFGQSIPDNCTNCDKSDQEYENYYNSFIADKNTYLNGPPISTAFPDGYFIKYNGTGKTKELPSGQSLESAASDYIIWTKSAVSELFNDLDQNKNNFNEFCDKIKKALESNINVEFSLVASANANGSDTYNKNLSKRRMDSVIKTIINKISIPAIKYENLKSENVGDGVKFFDEKKTLTINAIPEGKNSILKTKKYSNVDCSKSFINGQQDGKSSVQAMLCRRVTITDLNTTPQEPEEKETIEEKKDDLSLNPEGAEPNPNAAEENNTQNNTPQYETVDKTVTVKTAKENTEGLTKKLLRKLLSECSYFEMLQEQQPMVYDGIKSKIKNFHPVFHSMTPEGLNSRLTFLHQCVRPGDTIPTAVSAGNQGQTLLQYNDVFNSAFGTPPIVVIRVGDFYHTKAIIDSVTLKYDDAKFDINPEGIGVQPMIADVTLQLKFIGGHGLAGPVATLQNALTFNYYANTEMYDERAEETEPIYDKVDAELLEDIKNEFGLLEPKKNSGNPAGNTIGTILTNFLDVSTSAVTGTIKYKEKMNELVKATQEYYLTIFNNFESIKNETLIGGVVLYNSKRKYNQGLFNWLSGNSTNLVNIFGRSSEYPKRVFDLITDAKKDVDGDECPILANLNEKNFDNSEKRKIKRKIKQLIDEKYGTLLKALGDAQGNIVKNTLTFISITDQMNFISDKVDGYVNKRGGVVIYDLSGTTGNVHPTSDGYGTTNTFDEFITDFYKIKNDLNEYMFQLDKFKIIPTGDTFTYNTDYSFEMYLKEDNEFAEGYKEVQAGVNRFFMLFGKVMLNDYLKFADEIVSVIPLGGTYNEQFRDDWKVFILSNMGFVFDPNSNSITKRSSGLYQDFERSKKKTDELYKKFKDEFLITFLPNNTYTPFSPEKERIMDYKKQNQTQSPYDQNLKDVWSTVDVQSTYFNLKKTMS